MLSSPSPSSSSSSSYMCQVLYSKLFVNHFELNWHRCRCDCGVVVSVLFFSVFRTSMYSFIHTMYCIWQNGMNADVVPRVRVCSIYFFFLLNRSSSAGDGSIGICSERNKQLFRLVRQRSFSCRYFNRIEQ